MNFCRLLAGLLAAFILSSCNLFKPDLPPIVIGEFGSYTGKARGFGESHHKGVQMAIDEANENGGVKDRKLELIKLDNQSNIDLVPIVVQKLIEEHKVIAMIGEVASNRSLKAAPIAQENKVVMLSPTSSHPDLTKIGDYIFRACYPDTVQGRIMANFAFKNLKLKNIAVLKDKKTYYSRALTEFFNQRFLELGGNIVTEQNFSTGDKDFKKQLLRIKAKKPDAIFLPGYYTEVALIAAQARRLGIKATLLGGDGWDNVQLYQIAKDAVKGGYFTNHYSTQINRQSSKDFVRRFLKRYGHEPDGLSAMAFDATNMLIEALRNTPELTRSAVRDTLAKTQGFKGVTSDISLDENRDGIKQGVVVRVEADTNRYVTTVEP